MIQKVLSGMRHPLLPNEGNPQSSQLADGVNALTRACLPLWDMPVAFVLSSLEGARVRMAERRFEAGETIYGRGDPDRHL